MKHVGEDTQKPLWQEGETRSLGNNPYKILPSLEMLMS
jgi:hypothetical protein